MNDFSLIGYFINASFPVQLIMLILLGISIVSWAFIIQHNKFLKRLNEDNLQFEREFWGSENLGVLYKEKQNEEEQIGMVNLFIAGFHEYIKLSKKNNSDVDYWNNSVQRSMFIAQTHEIDKAERHLNFLATAGSISPYIGLLGTVWGIMNTLQALSGVEHATISMVAPGISETLVATALGLFAAIPAYIAYNRFSETVAKLETQFQVFREEFTSLMLQQLDNNKAA